MSNANGKFVWHELMTTDVNAAKRFYGEIIGWKTESGPGGGDYWIWTMGETPMGGLTVLAEEQRKAGVPPHWMGTIATEDVDATLKKALSLGGSVLVPGTDMPEVGRFAVLADPQGAAFGVLTAASEGPLPERNALGAFSWAELNTTDWKAAWKFYSELFGWKKTSSMDMGNDMGEYFMFTKEGDESMGGMSNAANMMHAPAHWLFYTNVKDADETAKQLSDKGAKVLNGPMDVPGGDRIAQCMDPQGGMFAIYSAGTAAKK